MELPMSPRAVLSRGLAATALALGIATAGTAPAFAAQGGPYEHTGFPSRWHCQISMRATAALGIEITDGCARTPDGKYWSYTYRAF